MMNKYDKEIFEIKKKLLELEDKSEIFKEFQKHLKSGDVIHIPEVPYDPFSQGYHPIEIHSTEPYIYGIENSISKEHYFNDLKFYLLNDGGIPFLANTIKDSNTVKQLCIYNRNYEVV